MGTQYGVDIALSGNLEILDNKKIKFGSDYNSYIWYDESSSDRVEIGGTADWVFEDNSNDFDIASHDAGTNGLKLGGTLVTSTAAELNLLDTAAAGSVVNSKAVIYGSAGQVNATTLSASAGVSGSVGGFQELQLPQNGLLIASAAVTTTAAELNVLDGVTAGTVAASKGVVVDSNKDIASFRHLTAAGAITAGTSFIIGSADLNEADMEKLDGITDGTVAANKAVVVDGNKDANGFRNVDGTGDLTMGTITMSGFAVDADGDTALKSLKVDDDSTIGCDSDSDLLTLSSGALVVAGTLACNTSLTIGSAVMSEADLEKLDDITNGTAAASKALVLDSNKDISGINTLACNTLDVQVINNQSVTTTTLEVADKLIIAASGSNAANSDAGGLQIGGTSGSDSVASILYDNSNSALDFNIGGTTEMRLQDGVLRPETDNDVDLGASGAEFKDLYLDGTAYLDTVDIDAGAIDGTTIGASSQESGKFTTLSASSGLNVVGTANFGPGDDVVIAADGGLTIGHMDANWTNAGITVADMGTVTTMDLNGGNIDGTVIGATSAQAGTFAAVVATSLNVSDGNITNVGDINCDSISVDDAAQGLNIDFSGANTTKAKITMGDNLASALSIGEGGNAYLSFCTSDGSEAIAIGKNWTASGVTCADLGTVTTADINGGTADNVVIGGATPAAASFTTLSASSGLNVVGAANFGPGDDVVIAADGGLTIKHFDANWTNAGNTVADLGSVTTVDINGGTVDAITSLTVANNVDVGNYTVRAKGLLADDLTSGRVVFAGTNGVLSDDSDLTFSSDTLTATKLLSTQIGVSGDVDLLQLSANTLAVNGNVGANDLSGSQDVHASRYVNVGQGYSTSTTGVTLDGTTGNVLARGGATFGANGDAATVTAFGAATGEMFRYDADNNHCVMSGSGGTVLLTIGGDANGEYAVDVANGSNNINKIRAAAFVVHSDRELKTNIQTLNDEGALEKVMKLDSVTYDLKNSPDAEYKEIGFIAQDVAKIVPEVCAFDEAGTSRGIDYSRLTSLLVGAIKTQQTQIDILRNKLENR